MRPFTMEVEFANVRDRGPAEDRPARRATATVRVDPDEGLSRVPVGSATRLGVSDSSDMEVEVLDRLCPFHGVNAAECEAPAIVFVVLIEFDLLFDPRNCTVGPRDSELRWYELDEVAAVPGAGWVVALRGSPRAAGHPHHLCL